MAVCAVSCGRSDDGSSVAVSAPSPATIHAAVTDEAFVKMPVRIEATGQTTALFQTTLASRIQGAIQEIRVREGSVVLEDEVLVVLDSRDLRANLARAQANLDNKRVYLTRIEDLSGRGSAAKQDVDDARRAFKVAEAERQAAAAHLTYTSIKAPFAGTITEKMADVGDMALPGRPLLKMEDSGQLRLEAIIAESDMQAVRQGDETQVLIDALGPHPLRGVIAQILPAGDPRTHTFLVKVTLPRTPGLKTGMFGRLLLHKGTSETLVVPRSAVVERGQLTGVFVVEPDRIARLRWVKIGRSFEEAVEVLSGLNAGERVMIDAAKGVDGVSVDILHSHAAPVAP
jgi:RND family efflux transporter MFP subunit